MGHEGHHHEGTSCRNPLHDRGGDIDDVKGHVPAHLRDHTVRVNERHRSASLPMWTWIYQLRWLLACMQWIVYTVCIVIPRP